MLLCTPDAIKPALTLVSGDLTDGKAKGGVDSFQIEEEWRTYQQILSKSENPPARLFLVGWLVLWFVVGVFYFPKRAGSYTSMLLSKHLLINHTYWLDEKSGND